MPKAALHNLGCKVNAYETESMQQQLEARGYEIVPFDQQADVYIINTCSVTNIADRKSRQMLHRAKKLNPQAVVVAAGCYVQVAADSLKKDDAVDIIIGNNKKGELADILDSYLKEGGRQEADLHLMDIAHEREYEALRLSRMSGYTRAFIKVQDGCNQFCSYCIIPYARGRVRSRQPESVIREVKELVSRGYKEVVITGIHLSSYGMEHKQEGPVQGGNWDHGPLLDLIKRMNGIQELERIRLGSLEPRIITEKFAGEMAAMPKLCPHFHLSLQSGCDETLRRMNRRYTTEDYLRRCGILRSCFQEPAITTDVIVGFPGETDQEFEQTREFLEQVRFYELHVFKYSKRAGTRAAVMPDQVPEPVKRERSDSLLRLGEEMSREYRSRFAGREISVLFEEAEEIKGRRYMTGFTPQYVKAALLLGSDASQKALSGQICRVRAGRLLDDQLLAVELEGK